MNQSKIDLMWLLVMIIAVQLLYIVSIKFYAGTDIHHKLDKIDELSVLSNTEEERLPDLPKHLEILDI